MHYVFLSIYSLAIALQIGFSWTAIFLKFPCFRGSPHRQKVNTAWKIFKWPALVGIFLQPVCMIGAVGHLSPADSMAFLMAFGGWYFSKDAGDDDFTNKLKDKLKEKVERIHGKLVVVPEPA